MIHMNKIR